MVSERPWQLYPEQAISKEMAGLAGGYSLISQYFARRGLGSVQDIRAYLDPDQYPPAPPSDLPGLGSAVERLSQAIRAKKRICVWGDFDVDGQTATALLFSSLRQLGAEVRYHIPIREHESHGIQPQALQKEIDLGFDLLLTCDTGIAAHAAIQRAAAHGIQTIVTDHHALPTELPPAEVIINPRLLSSQDHPLASLPGVGVAFMLAEALFDHYEMPQASQEYLDLVALGIVADVASLQGDNRYLLQLGLRQLQDPSRPALQALYETAQIKPGTVNEETIAFALAPRLNAVGRLADANPMVDFFTTSDLSAARLQAQVIEGLNAQRKLLTDQVFKAAIAQVERDPSLLDTSALVIAYPTWPAGVIGIIASRLVEFFHKPVVLFSTPPGEPGRGSARSIPGIDITQAIASQADLLLGYGGHPMAAGLSLQPEYIPGFRQGLSQAVDLQLAQRGDLGEGASTFFIDAYYPFGSLSLDFIDHLERLSPFGPGNPTPVLVAQNVRIDSSQPVGLHDEHLRLRLLDPSGSHQDVIWWQAGSLSSAPGFTFPDDPFDLAYTVHSHDFRGQRSIQVEWLDYRLTPQDQVSLASPLVERKLVDYRRIDSPLEKLQELVQKTSVQVWAEGPGLPPVPTLDRFHLEPNQALIVWTVPPSRSTLVDAITRTRPDEIYLFGSHPGLSQLVPFIERLSGLVKYALRHTSQPVELSTLATALAHQPDTLRMGLSWLQAKGIIVCEWVTEERVLIKRSSGQALPNFKSIEASLTAALEETEAFRRFYLRQDFEALL